MVEEQLDKLIKRITILYGISKERLLRGDRHEPYVDARQVFAIVAFEDLDLKYRQIGSYLDMDHSTISNLRTGRKIKEREQIFINYLQNKLENDIQFLAGRLIEEPENRELQIKMLTAITSKL